jgi:hypothetical protein
VSEVTDCLLLVGMFFVVTNGRGRFPIVFSPVSSTNPESQLRLCVSFGSETRRGEDNDNRSYSSEETSNGLRLGHVQGHALARLSSGSIWMCINCKCQAHFCLGMGRHGVASNYTVSARVDMFLRRFFRVLTCLTSWYQDLQYSLSWFATVSHENSCTIAY